MKKHIIILLAAIVLLCVGCTPQKRLTRMYKNYPELFTNDTVIKTDYIIIPAQKLDSVFVLDFENLDTIIEIQQENISARLTIAPAGLPNKGIVSIKIDVSEKVIEYEKATIINKQPVKVEKKIGTVQIFFLGVFFVIVSIVAIYFLIRKSRQ